MTFAPTNFTNGSIITADDMNTLGTRQNTVYDPNFAQTVDLSNAFPGTKTLFTGSTLTALPFMDTDLTLAGDRDVELLFLSSSHTAAASDGVIIDLSVNGVSLTGSNSGLLFSPTVATYGIISFSEIITPAQIITALELGTLEGVTITFGISCRTFAGGNGRLCGTTVLQVHEV